MKLTRKVYCCPAHALCDVDLPGSIGRRAREWHAEHAGDIPEWCGKPHGWTGQEIRRAVQ